MTSAARRVLEAYQVHADPFGEEAQALTIGFEALFGEAKALCPSGRHAQCSYTPQTFNLKLNEWTHHELSATCRFQPDKTGYYGAAGMVSLELLGAGAAWVDDVVLTLVFQDAAKESSYTTDGCEIVDQPKRCPFGGNKKIPEQPPALSSTTAKLLCKNQVLPCGALNGLKAVADVNFTAAVRSPAAPLWRLPCTWPRPPNTARCCHTSSA